jgi:acetolactate synthase-1/2/3 large subunit
MRTAAQVREQFQGNPVMSEHYERMKDSPLWNLHFAERPVIVFGAGVRGAEKEARDFARLLGLPILVTWGARDLFPEAIGAFGTHGVKAANLAVQDCDWFLSVGTRLDTKSTGTPVSWFAPKARRWMVDIEENEINKFQHLGLEITGIVKDAKAFLAEEIAVYHAALQHDGSWPIFGVWRAQCESWLDEFKPGPGKPYEIMAELGLHLLPGDIVVSDTGCVVAWAMQALKLPCRFIHAWNMTPMGYGVPAAIGAALHSGKRVILLTGDGGLNVNITELANVVKHNLPIKILLFNNRGHAMCRQTQRVWLNGLYAGTSDDDLAIPDFKAIAQAYGLFVHESLDTLMAAEGHGFLEFDIDQDQGVSPQVKFGERLEG